MPNPKPETSLYETIGGREGVRSLVGKFYELVLSDLQLAPFFAEVSMEQLRNMQFEFFSAALGGPEEFKGRAIAHAHQKLPIRRRHFQRFVEHLFTTLGEFPLSEQDRYEIIARINLYSEDVIGPGSDFGD